MNVVAVFIAAFGGAFVTYVLARRPPRPSANPSMSFDLQLDAVTGELERVNELVRTLERDRAEQYGALAGQLRVTGEQTARLADTTRHLQRTLTSPTARGAWGERMADDVLRAAGFVEGVNYHRQRAIATGGIPDFTVLLPRDRVLPIDVKFPLDNYLRARDATTADDVRRYDVAFLRDVRARVKELATRGYARGADAVDCVVMFVPNEAVFAFLHEHDAALVDDALRAGIVLCSPLTLFAVLAVVRQAVDTFAVELASREILDALAGFGTEWETFVAEMDAVGRRIDSAQRAFEALRGTRRRVLDRRIAAVADVRRATLTSEPAPTPVLGTVTHGIGG